MREGVGSMAFQQDVLGNKKFTMLACISVLSVLFIAGHLLLTEGITMQPPRFLYFNVTWHNTNLPKESVNDTQNDIWFIETSDKQKLTARQACSIESACRHNGDYNVHLLFTGNISSSHCPYHRMLSKLPNFRSARLNVSVELAGTALRAVEAALNRSTHKVVHLSDFLRYIVLWKHGGIYLDSDLIVTKSLKGIRNAVFYQCRKKRDAVANGILFFEKRHPVLAAIIDRCARVYDPVNRITCGPALMSSLPLDTEFSRRISFFNESVFFPVRWQNWTDLFQPEKAPVVLRATNVSYGVHLWNHLSENTRVVPGSGCAVDVLASTHCPEVYRRASTEGYF
ncbi:lactosylceramide 4-alpha-galactosyltransferase-like [Dermacentor albipictus]|uniref:lactosylceramide 4-alpha-galactosyltransferase-like n=1 Tax=Dermacentor albipictus TaxID=60249 RepID=UPI0031FDA74C